MEITFIYITAGSLDEAKAIGKALVSERLVACVNIIENMNSIYWWKDEIQDEREVVIIAKTKTKRVSDVVDKVKSIHSYDCPCIVSLPVLGGNKDFLDWIAKETV